jgi:TPR repeat protein
VAAQYTLSFCHVNGKGVATNHVEGYKWGLVAAAQGFSDPKKANTSLEQSKRQVGTI